MQHITNQCTIICYGKQRRPRRRKQSTLTVYKGNRKTERKWNELLCYENRLQGLWWWTTIGWGVLKGWKVCKYERDLIMQRVKSLDDGHHAGSKRKENLILHAIEKQSSRKATTSRFSLNRSSREVYKPQSSSTLQRTSRTLLSAEHARVDSIAKRSLIAQVE